MHKKYLYLSGIILIFCSTILYISAKTSPTDFQVFEQRVEKLCNPYATEKRPLAHLPKEYGEIAKHMYVSKEQADKNKNELTEKMKKYGEDNSNQGYTESTEPVDFENIQSIYRENMNAIYNCALLGTQKKTLEFLTNDLLKNDIEIKQEVLSQVQKIDIRSKALKCQLPRGKNSLIKAQVLQEATHQTCKYNSYLEYTRVYFNDLQNIIDITKKDSNIAELESRIGEQENAIDEEIDRIYKIFPIVYTAYGEYENNITQHYILQVIKKDYVALRKNLHNSLNPIAQLGYKAINATKPN